MNFGFYRFDGNLHLQRDGFVTTLRDPMGPSLIFSPAAPKYIKLYRVGVYKVFPKPGRATGRMLQNTKLYNGALTQIKDPSQLGAEE